MPRAVEDHATTLVRPAYPATVRVLTMAQVAEIMGVSKSTAWEYAQAYPDFPIAALGGKTYRVREDLLLDWIGSRVGKKPMQRSEDDRAFSRRIMQQRSPAVPPPEFRTVRHRQMLAESEQPLDVAAITPGVKER